MKNEVEIRQHLDFFKKWYDRYQHPLNRRTGYVKEMAVLTGMLIRLPKEEFDLVAVEVQEIFFGEKSCCPCDGKKNAFLYLIFKNRNPKIAQGYLTRLEQIQNGHNSRLENEYWRDFLREAEWAMEQLGKQL